MSKHLLNQKIKATRVLVLLLSLAFAGPAAADLMSAEKAYGAGDYDSAFKGFEELARLGQPVAQFNLAVMYARGEGTRQSEIYAYAWANLAAKNGMEKATALADALHPKLALAPGSDQIAADIEAHYGNTVLDRELFPRIVSDETSEAERRARCRPERADTTVYPKDAQRKGAEGAAYAQFSLLPDGRPRNPHIVYSVPGGIFDAAVRKSLLHSAYPKAPPGSKTVQCTIYYQFLIRGARSEEYPELWTFVSKTLDKAQAGDPGAQLVYGMLLIGMPQLNRPRSQAIPWFLKSAQAGVPLAQMQVGFSLLAGLGCDCEENKGLEWLRRAAHSGQPDAEVLLAAYALHGTPDEGRWRQARLCLPRHQSLRSGIRSEHWSSSKKSSMVPTTIQQATRFVPPRRRVPVISRKR